MRWSCTTCGASHFRKAVLSRASCGKTLTEPAALGLLQELRESGPATHPNAVEFLLRWIGGMLPSDQIRFALRETSTGSLYEAMLRAKSAADASRAEYALRHDPAFVAADRARKAAERAAQHQERLAAKQIRDAERQATLNDVKDDPV